MAANIAVINDTVILKATDQYIGNDSSINRTSSAADFRKSYMFIYMIIVPVYIVGIIANVLLVMTIRRRKQFQTPSYILSANMAISDIIVLGFGSVFLTSNVVLSLQSNLQESSYKIICQLNYFLLTLSYITSSQSFMLISIDRYLTMNRNRNRSLFQRKKILLAAMLLTWLIGLGMAWPMLYLARINPKFPFMCDLVPHGMDENYSLSFYHLLAIAIAYPIPLITVSCLYYKIIRNIKGSVMSFAFTSNVVFKRSYRQVHATKMMLIATILFMVNSMPIMIAWTVAVLTGKSYVELVLSYGRFVFILISTAFLVASFTAIQNPIIFLIYNKSLRKAMISSFQPEFKSSTTSTAISRRT